MNNEVNLREEAQTKYNTARSNLILMLAFTLINVILLVVESDVMLLFSATVPYFVVAIGVGSEISSILTGCIVVAAIIMLIYLLCWFFSKKHYGWIVVALVLFILDSIAMCALYIFTQDFSGILDVVFHVWILYYLIIGVKYGSQLKKLPEEEITTQDFPIYEKEGEKITEETVGETSYLRKADDSVKARVLLEANEFGHIICYRRVKRINELVIDGYVYDDVEMLIEGAHSLNAIVDGHKIQVGFDGGVNSYLRIDGETIAKKKRFY